MAKEYAHWKVRLIDIEHLADLEWDRICTLPTDPRGNAIVCRDNQWYRQQLLPLHDLSADQAGGGLYRPGGVYVVIGGAGGIGEVWSEYMIRTWRAQVIWIGRRPQDDTIQAKLERLAALGPAPLYIAADATDREALARAYREIKQHFPRVHGVIHAALVFSSSGLATFEESRFRAILASKVDVSVRLAQVFGEESLDFVLFFSSINAFWKAPGSSGYASGCTFKDAFAHQLSRAWPATVKVINWGYWSSIGAAATSAPFQQWMAQSGLSAVEPAQAMAALAQFLVSPINQMVLTSITGPSGLQGMEVDWSERVFLHPRSDSPEGRVALPADTVAAEGAAGTSHTQLGTVLGARLQSLQSDLGRQLVETDELLARLMQSQLQRLGGPISPRSAPDARRAFKATSGLLDAYDRWFDVALTLAERYDSNIVDVDTAWAQWERRKTAWLADPAWAAQVVLVESALRALPDILTGKCPATEVLFPNASMALAEGIYKNNPLVAFFNEVLADSVIAYIQARRQRRGNTSGGVRILEIGAGTGGTSATIFHKLAGGQPPYWDEVAEYCYTDISRTSLMHAEREYAPSNPYLTCQLFNVEAPIAGQGVAAGAYDLVIAANVLHATRNIRQTLRNAKAVLKHHGLLLLNEIVCNTLFTHLTFGLLEGGGLYEDADLRLPGCPGLSPQSWQKVLEQEGFHAVIFPAKKDHDLR